MEYDEPLPLNKMNVNGTFGSDAVVLKKGNDEPPLFCLYGVLLYKDLAESLNTERRVFGVFLEEENSLRHKGKDSEEFKVFSNVENIAARYLKSIKAIQPHGPYYLCGISFGGITALEVARKLENEGEVVQCVAMFDSVVSGYMNNLSKIKRVAIHLRLLRQTGLAYLKQTFIKYIKRPRLIANLGIQYATGIEDIARHARTLAERNYIPKPYNGKVILFRARERSEFDPGWDDLGWGQFIQNLEVHEIKGDHMGILKHGHVEMLANILDKKLG